MHPLFKGIKYHSLQYLSLISRSHYILAPTGEGCQGIATGSNPEPERGQPAPPGGVLQRLDQAQEVHRVGVQHHRHELTHRAGGCSTSGA